MRGTANSHALGRPPGWDGSSAEPLRPRGLAFPVGRRSNPKRLELQHSRSSAVAQPTLGRKERKVGLLNTNSALAAANSNVRNLSMRKSPAILIKPLLAAFATLTLALHSPDFPLFAAIRG